MSSYLFLGEIILTEKLNVGNQITACISLHFCMKFTKLVYQYCKRVLQPLQHKRVPHTHI